MQRDVWAVQLVAAETLRAVLDVAASARIDVLPVKGVVTARLLYADPAERPLADIDVRVRPRDLSRLLAAGRTAGWVLSHRSRAYRNVVFEIDGRMVDVETTVGPRGMCALTVEAMLARSKEHVAPFGFAHRQPELHDHALLLCLNVFKDKLVLTPPHAIGDLERIARADGFDPERLARLARETSAAAIAGIVAEWLAEERGAEPWRRVASALGPTTRPLYARAYRGLLARGAAESTAMRVLARCGADTSWRSAEALAWMGAWVAEERARRALARG